MISSTYVAHVADAIERLSGTKITKVQDYDVTADFAGELLHDYPTVQSAVKSYDESKITQTEFDRVVSTAVQLAGE